KVKEDGKATSVSHKDSKEQLEEYFFSVLPDYDEDRVYLSDIKKVIQWYNLLEKNQLLSDLEVKEEDDSKDVVKKEVAAKPNPNSATVSAGSAKASTAKKG